MFSSCYVWATQYTNDDFEIGTYINGYKGKKSPKI